MSAERTSLDRFNMLASAIAGRPLEVRAVGRGEASWTDGQTVFIDAQSDRTDQLQCIAVQASLLCAGSLESGIIRRLTRKPSVMRRYLSLEGHRALTMLEPLLPISARKLTDHHLAKRTDSPRSSLHLAVGPTVIPDPPETFGVIRPRLVLEPQENPPQGLAPDHVPRREVQAQLGELDDGIGEAPVFDFLSSPVGGGGPIGRLLRRLLGDARTSGSGAPGADMPTSYSRSGNRVSRMGTRTTNRIVLTEDGLPGAPLGAVYPEWDVHHHRYKPGWCTVVEIEPDRDALSPLALRESQSLRRALARLGTDLERQHRQLQGEDIDVDAAVDSYVEAMVGTFPEEAIYIESQRRRRDLAVLVLLDISGSTAESSPAGGTVHQHQRSCAVSLTTALYEVGDRVSLYGFRSQGRTAVQVIPVKRFDDGLAPLTQGRLGGLVPGGFTRLGAAIRHGAAILERDGGTGRRLLVVLSDGFAYDHGYEGTYGESDARRALSEARHRGIGCLCLSIGSSTDANVLRRVFGTAAHASLATVDELSGMIGPLFRVALGTAELQRKRAQKAYRAEERLQIEGRRA